MCVSECWAHNTIKKTKTIRRHGIWFCDCLKIHHFGSRIVDVSFFLHSLSISLFRSAVAIFLLSENQPIDFTYFELSYSFNKLKSEWITTTTTKKALKLHNIPCNYSIHHSTSFRWKTIMWSKLKHNGTCVCVCVWPYNMQTRTHTHKQMLVFFSGLITDRHMKSWYFQQWSIIKMKQIICKRFFYFVLFLSSLKLYRHVRRGSFNLVYGIEWKMNKIKVKIEARN